MTNEEMMQRAHSLVGYWLGRNVVKVESSQPIGALSPVDNLIAMMADFGQEMWQRGWNDKIAYDLGDSAVVAAAQKLVREDGLAVVGLRQSNIRSLKLALDEYSARYPQPKAANTEEV